MIWVGLPTTLGPRHFDVWTHGMKRTSIILVINAKFLCIVSLKKVVFQIVLIAVVKVIWIWTCEGKGKTKSEQFIQCFFCHYIKILYILSYKSQYFTFYNLLER